MPITSTRMAHLWDALAHAYDVLGFAAAAGGDEVFRQLVLARIIEPTSKLDSARVLEEVGASTRRRIGPCCAGCRSTPRTPGGSSSPRPAPPMSALGPASLVLYDVSTLYFETDAGDGFREPGFSKERRLEPQITIGLLTDAAGFPLMVNAFEGNKAETTTMLPVMQAFMAAHRLPDVTVVADAGMVSAANQKAIEAAGLSFILGARIPDVPYVVKTWRKNHPDEPRSRTGTSSPSPGPPAPPTSAATRSSTTSTGPTGPAAPCAESTSRSPRPRRPSPARRPVKRNRFVQLTGGTRSVNRALEAKARRWPGSRATSPTCRPAQTARRSPPSS